MDTTITPENRQRFEALGLERVRLDMLRGFEGSEIARGTDRQQALEWISERDRVRGCWSTSRDAVLILLAAIAAAATVIAAWPVVSGH
jgi:hypothetical protein